MITENLLLKTPLSFFQSSLKRKILKEKSIIEKILNVLKKLKLFVIFGKNISTSDDNEV